jgi:hypothetical protein
MSTRTFTWKTVKPKGISPVPRRYHSAVVVGATMLMYGGQGESGEFVNDLIELNLKDLRWIAPSILKETSTPPLERHSHTMVSVFPRTCYVNNSQQILQLGVHFRDMFTPKTVGFYMFGGVDSTRKARNDLYIL